MGVAGVIRLDASRPARAVIGRLSDRGCNIVSAADVPFSKKTAKRSDPVTDKHMLLGRGWFTVDRVFFFDFRTDKPCHHKWRRYVPGPMVPLRAGPRVIQVFRLEQVPLCSRWLQVAISELLLRFLLYGSLYLPSVEEQLCWLLRC